MVQRAASGDSADADVALESLCRAYWQPLYCYVRRRGYTEEDAKDLTQAFFARLLDKNYLSAVDRRKGKFRSFLLASLEHFLANQWRDERAKKRGGGASFISFDDMTDEAMFRADGALAAIEPACVFEQQWALAVIRHALSALEAECAGHEEAKLFSDLKSAIAYEEHDASYADIATKHQTTEAAVKMRVTRWRKRFGDLLVAELAKTVSTPREVEEELRALIAALG
jgi:RNA polymerase sigma-70 factor (ECF subfamily)